VALADQTYSAQVSAAGVAVVSISPGTKVRTWIVSQVSAQLASAPVGATCTLAKNGAFVTALVPTGDAAGGDPPIQLRGSDALTVTWTGCTPGTSATVFIVYDEVNER
jgi:hypothetical protein